MAPAVDTRRAEVVVQLPPIEVWRAFTRPDYLSYWIADSAEVDLRVGGDYNVRAVPWLDLRARIEKMIEGRRLVLRPVHAPDDTRIEVDLIKQAAAETRVSIAQPEPELSDLMQSALENMRSLWEHGVDLREARRGLVGVALAEAAAGTPSSGAVRPGAGVRITGVVAGGPAEGAGLRSGDVVVGACGDPVRERAELVRRIHQTRVGEPLRLEIVRGDERLSIDVVVAERTRRTQPPPSQIDLLNAMRDATTQCDRNLAEALLGLSDAEAYRPEAPGKWSIAQVLAHLSVTERMIQCALDEAIRGGNPRVDDESVNSAWRLGAVLTERPGVADLLARLRRDEVETLALIEGVAADVVAFRPRWARVAHLALDLHAHSGDHLPQIARIRRAISS